MVDTYISNPLKDCFIITPIGANNSETFRKADGLIRSVLKPVLKEHGFNALPAYEIDANGSITKQIIQHIVNDELVIANLTGLNPNVMYELAIRHSFKKKVITMAELGTKLPFDITDQRTIFYEDSLIGSEIVKPSLEKAIIEVLKNEVSSNPIIDSVYEAAILNTIKSTENPDKKDISKYLLERFDRLERMIIKNPNVVHNASFSDTMRNGMYVFKLPVVINENEKNELNKILLNNSKFLNFNLISSSYDENNIVLSFNNKLGENDKLIIQNIIDKALIDNKN